MIEAVEQIREHINNAYGSKEIDTILRIWAEAIIDECANVLIATRPDTSSQDITEVKEQL